MRLVNLSPHFVDGLEKPDLMNYLNW